jgi:hypothetical protein
VADIVWTIIVLGGLVALGLTLKAVAIGLNHIAWRFMTRPW